MNTSSTQTNLDILLDCTAIVEIHPDSTSPVHTGNNYCHPSSNRDHTMLHFESLESSSTRQRVDTNGISPRPSFQELQVEEASREDRIATCSTFIRASAHFSSLISDCMSSVVDGARPMEDRFLLDAIYLSNGYSAGSSEHLLMIQSNKAREHHFFDSFISLS